MSMSKIRANLESNERELDFPEEGDLKSFVIFTQKRDGDPHVFAGFVNAADAQMALAFGREHYGQDQECVNMWACLESAVSGTDADRPPSPETGESRRFQVLTQKRCGDWHQSGREVEAASQREALERAHEVLDTPDQFNSIWVVADVDLVKTAPDDLIWRYTDQGYRLARGYSKDVREKWEQVRQERDIDEYEKDNLKETF